MVNRKDLTENQRNFGAVFFWAGFYGHTQIVENFLTIGLSPFMKFYHLKNVVTACIEGWQYDLLYRLVKDSRQQVYNDEGRLSKDSPKYQKYKIMDSSLEAADYYWKSRSNKDQNGNNACHFVFEITDL